jgi:hypothetical protein
MKPSPSFDELEALITMKMELADSYRYSNPELYLQLKLEVKNMLEDLQENFLTQLQGR